MDIEAPNRSWLSNQPICGTGKKFKSILLAENEKPKIPHVTPLESLINYITFYYLVLRILSLPPPPTPLGPSL